MGSIKIAIAGVGNCASSLIQGIEYYARTRPDEAVGLMHWEIGGYRSQDLEVVAAFDIDVRKVGKDVAEAIFEAPNCTTVFCERLPKAGVSVQMGWKHPPTQLTDDEAYAMTEAFIPQHRDE